MISPGETRIGHFPLGFIKSVNSPCGNGYHRVYTVGRLSDSKLAMEVEHKGVYMWLPIKALRVYWAPNGVAPSPRLYAQHWAVEAYHEHKRKKRIADAERHGIVDRAEGSDG